MANVSSILSNQNVALLICQESDEILWCPPPYFECAVPSEEIDQQEYRRLTKASSNIQRSATKFKGDEKSESMSVGDKLALGTLVVGGAFLFGGVPGVIAALLAGCYGLEGIGSADEAEQEKGGSDSDAGTVPGPTKENPDDKNNKMERDPCEGKPPLRSYSGPAGTEGVGICQEEVRTCSDGSYQTTQEEVLPETEMPHDDLDNDCDGITDSDSWIRVSAGDPHTCGIRTDHTLECWGQDHAVITDIPDEEFIEVSVGQLFACAIRRDDNSIVCWGRDYRDQLNAPGGAFREIDAGTNHSCAIRAAPDNTLACWGWNYFYQADDNTDNLFLHVSAGTVYTCGVWISGDGAPCWGGPTIEDLFEFTSPNLGSSINKISVGLDHNCAVIGDGTVVCRGNNSDGERDPISGTYIDVGAGWSYTCGLRSGDRTVACWGIDGYGQSSPPPGAFLQISVGATHACGIKADDTIECWGRYDQTATPTP